MTDKLTFNLKAALLLLIPLLLLLVLQYRIWFDDSGVVASRALEHRISKLHEDNEVQQAENDALMAEVQDLRQGSSLLEEKAREDLGMVREGESFILFIDPKSPAKP
ncbi:FtsB family cell division protein [Thalassolituus marinus]|uniref:Cell division protein FtsB n=1 Tax=Thalassolituus marinus TaxID=671053 RepID=A0ABS7ZQF2_9GAMM|nr:septum formation initiator family protein [Thalassolituus marinus]MCA6063398.1 septum formation initiator family protein [Thalassolituus marinus]